MAAHAIRGAKGVIVVDVALSAGSGQVRANQSKAGGGVIERSHIGPGNRIVALRAISHRKRCSGGRMHRIVRLLPRGEVATGVTAIGRGDLQSVIVINVAARAGHIGVAVG
jgi:hypothetical protein